MEAALLSRMSAWMPWTVRSHRDRPHRPRSESDLTTNTHVPSDPNLLLSLIFPDVTNILMDHLDEAALLALRLVCRMTKAWVDQPRFLARLRITLHSGMGARKVRKVMRSKVSWAHFRFGYEKRPNEELLAELGVRFGSSLKVIDLGAMTSHGALIALLKHCQTLDSLSLLGLNLSKVPPSALDDLRSVRETLGHLKTLSVGNVLFVADGELEYFAVLVGMCVSLRYLRLPYVNFGSKSERHIRNRLLAQYLVAPVTNLITVRSHTGSPNLRHLVLEFLNPALPPPLFASLALTCTAAGTLLHNVHESHLRALPNAARTMSIVGTLEGLNEGVKLSALISLSSLSVWVSSALSLSEGNLLKPDLPRLRTLNLFVDSSEDDPRIQGLVDALLETPRPTVLNLKISYNSRGGPVSAGLVRAEAIASNFRWVRRLDVYQWEAWDEEFRILWGGEGAHRIKELSLLLCTNLSDKGLVGSPPTTPKPPFLNLTGLKELHVSSLYGSITDVSMQQVFRHMTLQKFRLVSQSVTYEGVASLLQEPLALSIESLHVSKPLDCSQKDFHLLVRDILNAKYEHKTNKDHKRPSQALRRRSGP